MPAQPRPKPPAPDQPPGPATLIPLGTIVGPHALRGELRVRLFNPDSTTLRVGATVVLQRAPERQARRVAALRPHRQFTLLTLDGCASITAAEQLVGYEVCVAERDLPPAGAGEVYHYQLLGMTVVTTAGVEVGRVAEVLALPSNDVCVVRGEREYLIPFIADVVKEVDRDRRRLLIDPLPGLLDP